MPHSANIDCSSYPPTIEDYASPQRDKLKQLMGPDPRQRFDTKAAYVCLIILVKLLDTSTHSALFILHGKLFDVAVSRFCTALLI
ncbi:MAG: hypothetical protein ACI901_001807 [Octadecabacter sp.]